MHNKGAENSMDENLKNSENNDELGVVDQGQALPVSDRVDTSNVVSPEPEGPIAPDLSPTPETAQPTEVIAPDPVVQAEAPIAAQTSEPVLPVPPTKKGLSKKTKSIIAIILAATLLAAGIVAYFVVRSLNQAADSDAKSSKVVKDTDTADADASTTDKAVATYPKASYHIKAWNYKKAPIDTRIKLPAKVSSNYTYYTVATLDDGATLSKMLTDDTNEEAPGEVAYFVVTSSKVVYVSNLSVSYLEGSNPYGTDVIEVTIPEFNPTESVTYDGQTFITTDTYGNEYGLSNYKSGYTVTSLTTTKTGNKFYQITSAVGDITDYGVRAYDLVTPDGRSHRYQLESAMISNDDATLKVTWTDGSNKAVTFSNPVRGCSAGYANSNAVLGFSPDISTAIKVGTVAATGKPAYRLTTAGFVQGLYDEYSAGRDIDKISLDAYKTKLTHIVFQDGFGKWILLQNNNYGPNGECGKPVIYLYPTKTTSVNVMVGADVTVSDPIYPANGWRNVTAQPNGALKYNGRSYESLFWEGKGHGLYPSVGMFGTVVPQGKLLGTLRAQLAAQGLNTKETNDFMDFWSDHLPKTPYVKLTWLTKAQIDELAPLRITPKPTTVIRVFLDAKGLNAPVSLVPQTLTAPSRQGFTVVEWGGLISSARQ